jgi:Tfp pilus assembly protein PilZ
MLQNGSGMPISRALRILTILMVGFPLVYPLIAAFAFNLPSKGVVSIVISPLFYVVSVFWVASGLGIQSLRHWAWYTFVMAQVLSAYLGAFILANYSESQFKVAVFVSGLLIQYLMQQTVSREMRVPYLFPKIRWWESGIAGIHHLPVEFTTRSGAVFRGQLLDISTKGCFVKSPFDFSPGEEILMKVEAYGHALDLAGWISWSAKSAVTHPKGIGIRFAEGERVHRKRLRNFVKSFNLEKEAPRGSPSLSS